jgi:hemerythrin HHE cation binding domain-containing protein
MLNSKFLSNGIFNVPEALRLDHDEIRAELARATMEPGPIGKAAMRLARYCLPHFEHEEKAVFPAFGVLHDLSLGEVRPEMADILPLISDFSARHDALASQHQSIVSAVEALLQAANKEKNREIADFAYNLRVHEKIEDEVIYPTVILIGNYVRERLTH